MSKRSICGASGCGKVKEGIKITGNVRREREKQTPVSHSVSLVGRGEETDDQVCSFPVIVNNARRDSSRSGYDSVTKRESQKVIDMTAHRDIK